MEGFQIQGFKFFPSIIEQSSESWVSGLWENVR